MFAEINVCSDITEELEMADTISDTALVGIKVDSKQITSDVLEKEKEEEIPLKGDSIKLSTGYLNVKDCNEHKDEGAISSDGDCVETDSGNKNFPQTILSYLYLLLAISIFSLR